MPLDDAWLTALLLERDWSSDTREAGRTAAGLAAQDPAVDRTGGATRALLSALAGAWERGWQPADVVHAVGRGVAARARSLTVALIAEHARVHDAAARAPAPWREQLRELGALGPGDSDVVGAWYRSEGRSATDTWRVVLLLASTTGRPCPGPHPGVVCRSPSPGRGSRCPATTSPTPPGPPPPSAPAASARSPATCSASPTSARARRRR